MTACPSRLSVIASIAVALTSPAAAQECPAPSGPLAEAIGVAAQNAIDSRNAGSSIDDSSARVTQNWNEILSRALVQTDLSTAANTAAEMAETARTDKQIGPGPGAPGTTTMVEKANLPALLGLAIEHGAIQQEQEGTSLTLRTTPYSLFALVEGDTPGTFERRWWARRLGVAGVFSLDTSRTTGAGGFDFDQFQMLSVRLNAIGDRSPRSSGFTREWIKRVRDLGQQEVDEAAVSYSNLLNQANTSDTSERLLQRRDKAASAAIGRVKEKLPTANREDIESAIWVTLCEEILKPRSSGELGISDEASADLAKSLEKQMRLRAKSSSAMKEALAEFNKRLAVTVGWDLNRVQQASDYSAVKIIADGYFGWESGKFTRTPEPSNAFAVAANGFVSLNHSPGRAPGGGTVRDYGATFSLQKSVPNIVTGRFVNERDLSRINIDLSGEVKRLETVNGTLGAAQIRFELPVFSGFTIPLAFTYSSRTETSSDDELRVNVGGVLDTDKLAALGRLLGI